MRKLKRIRDGKVFDCTIILDGNIMCCIFFENDTWYQDYLTHFVPAEPRKDY